MKPHPLKHRNPFLVDSDRGNLYFFDSNLRKTLLCHPVLFHLLRLRRRGIALERWIDHLPAGGTRIGDCGRFTRNQILYQYRKYLLLEENGYFDDARPKDQFDSQVTRDAVRRTLANLNHVVFEVTDGCNLRCEYCGYGKFYQDYDIRQNRRLDFGAAKRLLDYLVPLWSSTLNRSHRRRIAIGFYGGEPLLNFPFVEQMVDYVGRLNLPRHSFAFSMTTNGLLLERYMDYLKAHDFLLLISLDGNERNNSYRVSNSGVESFSRTYRSAKALQTKYPEYFREKVGFNAVFHNRSDIGEVHQFFKEHFDKMPSVSELNPNGIREDKREEFQHTYSNVGESLARTPKPGCVVRDFFINLPTIDGLSKFIHAHNDFCFKKYAEMLLDRDRWRRYPSGTCLPFLRKLFLTVNNKILVCERIAHRYSLGCVTERGVELDLGAIAAQYTARYRSIAKVCRHCYRVDGCGLCLFYENVDAGKPACSWFMNHREFEAFLRARISCIESHAKLYSQILEEVYYE